VFTSRAKEFIIAVLLFSKLTTGNRLFKKERTSVIKK